MKLKNIFIIILFFMAFGGSYVFLSKPEVPKKQPIQYVCEKEKSALQLLETYNTVGIKETSFGKQVIAVNGIEQGNGKYWLYYVNSKEATVSAEAYICQGTEQITWELK